MNNTYANIMTKSAGEMYDLCEREIERRLKPCSALRDAAETRREAGACATSAPSLNALSSIT